MTHSEHGKWVHSTSDEIFSNGDYCDSKEEAIAEGRREYDESFYVGQVQSVNYAIGVSVDDVLEHIHQTVYDEVGEVAEDYLNDVEKDDCLELEADLHAVVHDWMKRKGHYPNFYHVVNIEKADHGEL